MTQDKRLGRCTSCENDIMPETPFWECNSAEDYTSEIEDIEDFELLCETCMSKMIAKHRTPLQSPLEIESRIERHKELQEICRYVGEEHYSELIGQIDLIIRELEWCLNGED